MRKCGCGAGEAETLLALATTVKSNPPLMTSLMTSNMQLAKELAKYYADPLGFVRLAYPWGEKGSPLENEEGPDANHEQFLIDLGAEVVARGFRGGSRRRSTSHRAS